MEKVVLITGASTGIGNETAKLFQSKNWKVAATMRSPEKAEDLQRIADVECIRLDVTDQDSVRDGIRTALDRFGRIDAIVNNAGFALVGPFEAASDEQIEQEFQTNVFGVMFMCREILPIFREQKRGVIVNVASMGGRVTFPLYSVYHSTKWAVEGFSESLAYELRPFGIRVKIVEPGVIRTDFYGRSAETRASAEPTPYDAYAATAMDAMTPGPASGSSAEE